MSVAKLIQRARACIKSRFDEPMHADLVIERQFIELVRELGQTVLELDIRSSDIGFVPCPHGLHNSAYHSGYEAGFRGWPNACSYTRSDCRSSYHTGYDHGQTAALTKMEQF